MKQGIVEVEGLKIAVYYSWDGSRGEVTTGDDVAMMDLMTNASKEAVLRPAKGDPIPIHLMSGEVNLIGQGQRGVAITLRTEG